MLSSQRLFFDRFLLVLDDLIRDDEQLVNMLTWAADKAAAGTPAHRPVAVRSYYISHALDRAGALEVDRADTTNSLWSLKVGGLNDITGLSNSFILALDRDLARRLHRPLYTGSGLAIYFPNSVWPSQDLDLDQNLALDRDLAYALDHARSLFRNRNLSYAYDCDRSLSALIPRILSSCQELGLTELYQAISGLVVPSRATSSRSWHELAQRLQDIAIEHQHIGYDWEFNAQQWSAMQQYLYAAELLVQCLDFAYGVDRCEIENRLLLPPDWDEVEEAHTEDSGRVQETGV
jgi:hypothetical protein